MGPFHGAIINWFAHKYQYINFKVNNSSKNLLPVDFLMMGEAYHNNHHKHPNNVNFGYRWFEVDPTYPIILLLRKVGVIRFSRLSVKPVVSEKGAVKNSRKEQMIN